MIQDCKVELFQVGVKGMRAWWETVVQVSG